MNKQVTFQDLSPWLKTLVVFGFIALGYNVLAFILGLISGMGY